MQWYWSLYLATLCHLVLSKPTSAVACSFNFYISEPVTGQITLSTSAWLEHILFQYHFISTFYLFCFSHIFIVLCFFSKIWFSYFIVLVVLFVLVLITVKLFCFDLVTITDSWTLIVTKISLVASTGNIMHLFVLSIFYVILDVQFQLWRRRDVGNMAEETQFVGVYQSA